LETIYLASMTVGELRAGVALMPAGKRRKPGVAEICRANVGV